MNQAAAFIQELLGPDWVRPQLAAYKEFRRQRSPAGRWQHRPSATSPIIPLLHWNLEDTVDQPGAPFGYWGGHPVEILERLVEEIQFFESDWAALPDQRGVTQLRWALTDPQRFFSISHELATAFFMAKRPGVTVEPWFLDPQSSLGAPDFIASTTTGDFAVQCKSEDPTARGQMPYDSFQYFAGAFQRVVEDSGKSYHLSLQLKKRLDERQLDRILTRVSRMVRRGVVTPTPWRTADTDLELLEIGSGRGVFSLDAVKRRVLARPGAPLYQELAPRGIGGPASTHRLSSLFISGKRDKELHVVIGAAAENAVKRSTTDLPLIVAVHLYHEVDFREYPSRPIVKHEFIPWTDRFFSVHPNLAMIMVTSNYELYVPVDLGDSSGVKHARAGWVLESPVWDHADVVGLGI